MSIEDIKYLKANSIKQTYTFLIDSNERDRNIYSNPNNYVIEFSAPFRNIIAMEIIDASIPRTMYNVDIENNSIYYYIGTGDDDVLITNGVYDKNNCDIEVYNANIEDSFLRIIDRKFVYIKNVVNLYNIYNSGGIGGSVKGITISFKLTAFSSYKTGIGSDNSYTLLDFRYNHLINPKTTEDSPIIVKLCTL